MQRFVAAILAFLPLDVQVHDSNTVSNFFFSEDDARKLEGQKEPIPLFSIDLMLGEENQPVYSTSPPEVLSTIRLIFDNGLKSLQEIS